MGVSSRSRRAAALAVGALWAVILVAAMLGRPQAVQAAPLETYGRLPTLESIALSPDRSRIAFVRTAGTDRIFVAAEFPNKSLAKGSLGQVKLRHLMWADNDHLLIITSQTGMPWGSIGENTEWHQLSVFELSTKKFHIYPEPA
jgi:hypothetical protein